jgi:hypothetical protein
MVLARDGGWGHWRVVEAWVLGRSVRETWSLVVRLASQLRSGGWGEARNEMELIYHKPVTLVLTV